MIIKGMSEEISESEQKVGDSCISRTRDILLPSVYIVIAGQTLATGTRPLKAFQPGILDEHKPWRCR